MPKELLELQPYAYYIWWSITSNVVFDLDVIDGLISPYLSFGSDSEKVSEVYVWADVESPEYIDFAPNLLDPKYKWSKPVSSKGLGKMLKTALSKENSGFSKSVTNIYMEKDEMIWEIFGEDIEHPKSVVGGVSTIKNLDKYAKELMGYLSKLGKPVKEIYVIKDKDDNMKGKFIARKCSDGEYVLTVY